MATSTDPRYRFSEYGCWLVNYATGYNGEIYIAGSGADSQSVNITILSMGSRQRHHPPDRS